MSAVNISDMLTDKAWKELKKGSVLNFEFEGSITTLKIVKMNKKKRLCLADKTVLYHPDEVAIVNADDAFEVGKDK